MELSKILIFLRSDKVIWSKLKQGIVIGFVWFLLEAAFIFVMKSFLIDLGFFTKSDIGKFRLNSKYYSFFLLFFYAALRSSVQYFKFVHFNSIYTYFVTSQRKMFLNYGINNENLINHRDYINLFSERINNSAEFIRQISSLVHSSITTLLLIAFAFYLTYKELILGLILLIVFAWPMKKLNKKFRFLGEKLLSNSKKVTEALVLGLKNNKLLNIYNLRDKEIQRGYESIDGYKEVYTSYYQLSGFKQVVPTFLAIVILSILSFLSRYYFLTPVDVFLGFFYIFLRISQNLSYMNNSISILRLMSPSLEELESWEIRKKEIQILNNKKTPINQKKLVDKDHLIIKATELGFNYSNDKDLFENLNFKLTNGESLLIQGSSGRGKSTLLSLITGVLKPKKGKIEINDMDCFDFKEDLSFLYGYVGPDVYLNFGTIKENLLYGNTVEGITDQNIWDLLEMMLLKDKLWVLPSKLETIISDSIGLSTGEKQRLAIVRALLRKPRILILDEVTSHLDFETERFVVNKIMSNFEDVIKIITSHRESFDHFAVKKIKL